MNETKIIILSPDQRTLVDKFEKFIREIGPRDYKYVTVLPGEKRITTPLLDIYFINENGKRPEGLRADICSPYNPEIMEGSIFTKKESDFDAILGVFKAEMKKNRKPHPEDAFDAAIYAATAAGGHKTPVEALFDNMATAHNKEEFEEALRRRKPFQLVPQAQIMIVSIDPDRPPICQIAGDSNEIMKMFTYGISNVMSDQIDHGMPPEVIRDLWHKIADAAFTAEMTARKAEK